MPKTSILVTGAGGRMGRAVVAEVLRTPGITLAGGVERKNGLHVGKDIGALAGLDRMGLTVNDDITPGLKRASVIIDFTAPDASLAYARAAADKGVAHIIGTTGFSQSQEAQIGELAMRIPIVKSGNMSIGVNLLTAFVEAAARALGDDYDIEIHDAHHRDKVDAPSGTALMLGASAARGRGRDLKELTVGIDAVRSGKRKPGDIGFSVFRGGGIVGEHSVAFASAHETIRLAHSAIDRALFAKGAVQAAKWAVGKAPGLYSMRDVLGLSGANES